MTAVWNSGTSGQSCGASCSLAFQGDGNLVLYNNGSAYWASGSGGNANATLTVSATAPYLVITNTSGQVVWSSGN